MSTTTIFRHATRVWDQELVRQRGDGDSTGHHELIRTYREPVNPHRFHDTPGVEAGCPTVQFVAPTSVDPHRFGLDVDDQLATQLWPDPAPPVRDGRALETMAALGTALARLHAGDPDAVPGPSPHLIRATAHLNSPDAAVASTFAMLGADTVDAVRDIVAGLPTTGVRLHGGFSTASVFTDPAHTTVQVVTGPEITCGAPEFDLGWMIGELTEIEFSLSGSADSAAEDFCGGAAAALLTAHQRASGHILSPARLRGVVALRVFLHLCDYTATVGATASSTHLAQFTRWLIQQAGSDHNTREEVRS